MAKNKNALFLSVGRFWEHINGKHKTLQKKHSEGQGFLRTSPTEDNLSPSFWTCFSHYHEKVATLRSAFFDITHSERKKHSSLLGVLLTEMPPAPKKTPPVVRDVFFGADNQIRTGDLVLIKDVLYPKKRKCSIFIKSAAKPHYFVLFRRFFIIWPQFKEKW